MTIHADAVVLTALEKEYQACLEYATHRMGVESLPYSKHDDGDAVYLYFRSSSKEGDGSIFALAPPSGMGGMNAACSAVRAILRLRPKWIILSGITAGIESGDARYGDLIVPDQIWNTDLQKLEEGKDPKYSPQVYHTSSELADCIKLLKTSFIQKVIDIYEKNLSEHKLNPKILHGPLFSTNAVVADVAQVDRLLVLNRKADALEMEAGGIASILNMEEFKTIKFLPVKVVVDYAGKDKSDRWHEFGSALSAALALELIIQHGTFVPLSLNARSVTKELSAHVGASLEKNSPKALHAMVATYSGEAIKLLQRTISEKVFSADISSGTHFLHLAKPLFECSEKLYATSIDSISTFWETPENQASAANYLHCQPSKSHRLFVFKSARRVHSYAQILDAHTQQYQNVYVCTQGTYIDLQKKMAVGVNEHDWTTKDFALLYSKADDRCPQYLARLGQATYEWERICDERSTVVQGISLRGVQDVFDEWENMSAEELLGHGILKWEIGLWRGSDAWSKLLRQLFGELTTDSIHMVFFTLSATQRALLKELRLKIQRSFGKDTDQGIQYGVEEIWIGEKVDSLEVRDGIYRGRIHTNKSDSASKDQYVLIMKFSSKEKLALFYENRQHSKIRQELYEQIDPRVRQLYQCASHFADTQRLNCPHINEVTSNEGDTAVLSQTLYGGIEATMGEHLRRADYVALEHVEDMVRNIHPRHFPAAVRRKPIRDGLS